MRINILITIILLISLYSVGCNNNGDGNGECNFDFNDLLNGTDSEDAETVWECHYIEGDVDLCSSYLSFYEDDSGEELNQFFSFDVPFLTAEIGVFNWIQTDCNKLEVQSEEIGLWELKYEIENNGNLKIDWISTDLSKNKGFCEGMAQGSCYERNVEDIYSNLPAPTLIEPVNHAIIKQNDPNTGCEFDSQRGYGYMIYFDWSGSNQEYKAYRLIVQRKNSGPSINQLILDTDESEFLYVSCNGFVADKNLNDWEWFVLALDSDAKETKRGNVNYFEFEPCSINDSTPCSAD